MRRQWRFYLLALSLVLGTTPSPLGGDTKSTDGRQVAGNPLTDVSNLLSPFSREGLGPVSEGLGGVAWLDYNNDGFLDLFIANGAGHANGLFRNNGDGTFTDVAAEAGVANGLGNSGVVAVDIDNDGCTDLFLTGEGAVMGRSETPNILYVNNCDGTFTDITAESGIDSLPAGLMAAFGDINNDGFVDLFITGPGNIAKGVPQKNRLFLNNGNRTFTDISHSAGIDTDKGACAVVFSDFNHDGLADILVANCNGFGDRFNPRTGIFNPILTPFELFRNNGDLTFTDVAPQAGLAPNPTAPLLGMGFWMCASLGDLDGDGNLDLFATNIGKAFGTSPTVLHGLFRNNGDGTFTNVAANAGVANWEFGWGSSFADFDNDGNEDLFLAGSLVPAFGIIGAGRASPGRLFMNNGDGTFTNVASFGLENEYTTGVAVGDFDNNGFPDVVVVKTAYQSGAFKGDGRPVLLKNLGNDNNWITVRLVGTKSNRGGVGARVKVSAGKLKQVKEVFAGSGFLSTNSPWLTFGLGKRSHAKIEVSWPSGLVEQFPHVSACQTLTLVEGTGKPLPKEPEDESEG